MTREDEEHLLNGLENLVEVIQTINKSIAGLTKTTKLLLERIERLEKAQ